MLSKLLTALLPVVIAVTAVGADREPFTIQGWGSIVDPDGDCSVVIENDSIELHVPAGAHDLSAELNKMNAPRILQDVRGDFVAEIKIDGEFVTGEATISGRTAYNGAGLLLWLDDRNYTRLERAALKRSGQVRHYVNFEQRIDGKIQFFGAPVDFQVDATQPCYLRLERKGQQILGSAKQGDDPWRALIPNSAPLPPAVRFGIAAVNASDAPFAPQFSELQFSEPQRPSGESKSATKEPAATTESQ